MKRQIRTITAALLTTIAAACQHLEVDDGNRHQEDSYATYTIDLTQEQGEGETKSILAVEEDDIKSLNLFAFDASTGNILSYGSNAGPSLEGTPVKAYISGAIKSFEWSLPINKEMDIYAVCNLTEMKTPQTVNGLLSSSELVYTISDISTLNQYGIPMTGLITSFTDDGSGQIISIPVKRIVAKYTLRIKDIFDGFKINDVRICNVNRKTTLFEKYEAVTSSSGMIAKGDWAEDDDLNDLNNGNAVAFYMLENMQTTVNNLSTNVTSWKEVFDYFQDKGKGQYCTYLEIYATDGIESRLTRLYLGQDCKTNFDIKRNTVKNISITAKDLIDKSLDNIKFTNSSIQITAGEQITCEATYTFKINPERESDITFWTDPASSDVKIVSTQNQTAQDRAYVTLTCDKSTKAQQVTVWAGVEGVATTSMTVNVKEAAAEPVITYDYRYKLVGIPQMAVGESQTLKGVIEVTEYTDGAVSDKRTVNITASQMTSLNVSSGATYASVNKTTGILKALAAGTATIKSRTTYEGNVLDATLVVNVISPPVQSTTLTLTISDFDKVTANADFDEMWDFGHADTSFYWDDGEDTPLPNLYCFEGSYDNYVRGTVEEWTNLYNLIVEYDYDYISLVCPGYETVYCENSGLFRIIRTMIDNRCDATMNWLDNTPAPSPTMTVKIWLSKAYVSVNNNGDIIEHVKWDSDRYLKHTIQMTLAWSAAQSQHHDGAELKAGTATGTFNLGAQDDVEPREGKTPNETWITSVRNSNGTLHGNYTISADGQTVTVKDSDATYVYVLEF